MILGLLRGAGFAGAAALVALVVQSAVESADIGSPPVSLDAIATVKPRIEALAGPGVQIAFFGDSTAVYYPPGRTVPQQLQRALRRGQHVQTIGYDALHPFDVFFLADVVLEARPDAVVICLNLFSLSPVWQSFFARPEMASLVAPRRWPEIATLPIDRVGLTADRLVLGWSILSAGGFERWRAVQRSHARVESAYRQLASSLSDREGGAAQGPERRRMVEARYGEAFGGVGPRHPILRVLAAAVGAYTASGVPVLVYVSPVDLEGLAVLGVSDRHGLARTLRSLEEVVLGAGGQWVDLHDLLPDAGFRDDAGHLAYERGIDGPQRVANRLRRHVMRMAAPDNAARP